MSGVVFDIDEDIKALKKLKYKAEGEKKEQRLSKILFTTLYKLNPAENVASFADYLYYALVTRDIPILSELLDKVYKEHDIPDILTTAADIYASLAVVYSVSKLLADSSGLNSEERERLLRPIEEFLTKSYNIINNIAKVYYPQYIDIYPNEFTGLKQDIFALKEAIDELEKRLKAVEGGAISDWKLVKEESARYRIYLPPYVYEYLLSEGEILSEDNVLDRALMKGEELFSKYVAEPLRKFVELISNKKNKDFSEHMSLLFPPTELIQTYRQALNEIKQRYDDMVRYASKLGEDNRFFTSLINDLANIYADAYAINLLGLFFCSPHKYSICTSDVGIISEKIASTAQKMIENAAKYFYRSHAY